ncbi:MAG: transposase [Gemmatimonadetes bacterium]|nr:transposase [Gemmatimonadota bacterium]
MLGYSRLLWVRFIPARICGRCSTGSPPAWTTGAVSRATLLFDQMRSVPTRDDRLAGGGLLTNPECQRFAQHYGFRLRVCRPYRAQTKGKVERPIRYLRGSFLYGRTFVSDADLNAQVAHWLDTVANPRVHGTTGVVPAVRFLAEEQARLQPLPLRPYVSLLPPPRAVPPRPLAVPQVVVEHRSLAAATRRSRGEV